MRAFLFCVICTGLGTILLFLDANSALAKDPELPPLAQLRDANKNNRIERNEAAGPLVDNFDTMDCDKSGNLDGDEILGFFQGVDCPNKEPSKKRLGPARAANELLFNLYLPRTTSMFTKVVKPWSQAIEKATHGTIKIKFSASSLAPINRQLRMVATGVADTGRLAYSPEIWQSI